MDNRVLRTDDLVIVFTDLQEGIINVGVTADPQRLRTCVGALAEIAKIFALPVALPCVPTTSGTVAPSLAEIVSRFADRPQLVRTSANPFDDSAFRTFIQETNRHTLIFAGVATEVAVTLAAVAAQRFDYHAIVAVDACSGLDARSESAALMQLSALGITLSSVPAIAAELAGDFGSETGRAAMRALQSMVTIRAHDHSAEDDDEPEHEHQHGHNGSVTR